MCVRAHARVCVCVCVRARGCIHIRTCMCVVHTRVRMQQNAAADFGGNAADFGGNAKMRELGALFFLRNAGC